MYWLIWALIFYIYTYISYIGDSKSSYKSWLRKIYDIRCFLARQRDPQRSIIGCQTASSNTSRHRKNFGSEQPLILCYKYTNMMMSNMQNKNKIKNTITNPKLWKVLNYVFWNIFCQCKLRAGMVSIE